jgi:RNA polymerase sigma factor (sigma-70 family)
MLEAKKQTKFILLFDLYGNLLSKKEQRIFSEYYEENFSLTEIAENLKITRQAVSQRLEIIRKKLLEYEKKLRGK